MNSRHNLWALADQGVVSLGNFLTIVLLARVLTPHDYGVFAILFGVMLVLNNIHSALVVYPLSLEAAVTEAAGVAKSVTAGGVITLLLGIGESAVLIFLCLRLQRWDLMVVSIVALLLWQLQETYRRGLLGQFRFRDAVGGDAVSYIGQFLGLVALWLWNYLSVANILWIIAVTSFLAMVLQTSLTGVATPSFTAVRAALSRSWRLGKWVALTQFTSMVPAVPMYVLLLGMFSVPRDAAIMQALGNPLGATNPLMLTMMTLIVPAAAKARVEGGEAAAWERAKHYGRLFAIIIIPYYVLLFLAPRLGIALFYGRHSQYLDSASFLRWLVLSYALTYVALVIGSFLRATERMQVDFAANLIAALVALGSFVVAVGYYSPLVGGSISFLLATACRTMILLWWTVHITEKTKRGQVSLVTDL